MNHDLQIPAALEPYRSQQRWVVWRLEQANGKPTKRPYQPNNPSVMAKTNDPSTWVDADTAIRVVPIHNFNGIGINLRDGDIVARVRQRGRQMRRTLNV
jgi:primase-polymerase (primpol)-like protein